MKIYFSDFFNISPDDLDSFGAFNISLIYDLPLFIDPFLLFVSKRPQYQILHNEILDYLTFLQPTLKKLIYHKCHFFTLNFKLPCQ